MRSTTFWGAVLVVSACLALAACRVPDDDVPDADVVEDADTAPDSDVVEGDADGDADGVVEEVLVCLHTEDGTPYEEYVDPTEVDSLLGDADYEGVCDPRDILANCLTASGAVIYGAYWCSACHYQKYMFAPFHEVINYVDCYFDPEEGILDDLKQECLDVSLVDQTSGEERGLMAFPTWTFDTASPHVNYMEGAAPFETLAEYSGCEWLGPPTEL